MLQVYFIYSGTYTDTAIITRANITIYGQTSTPSSYTGNSMHTFFFSPFLLASEPAGAPEHREADHSCLHTCHTSCDYHERYSSFPGGL